MKISADITCSKCKKEKIFLESRCSFICCSYAHLYTVYIARKKQWFLNLANVSQLGSCRSGTSIKSHISKEIYKTVIYTLHFVCRMTLLTLPDRNSVPITKVEVVWRDFVKCGSAADIVDWKRKSQYSTANWVAISCSGHKTDS